MAVEVAGIHREHEELLDHVEHIRLTARAVPGLPPEERSAARGRVLDFLRGTLLPHAQLEERDLYPAVARLLGQPEAIAPMTYDHVAIAERVGELAEADPADGELLQELLYGLYALIRVHFWKEEELYLPLLVAGDAVRR